MSNVSLKRREGGGYELVGNIDGRDFILDFYSHSDADHVDAEGAPSAAAKEHDAAVATYSETAANRGLDPTTPPQPEPVDLTAGGSSSSNAAAGSSSATGDQTSEAGSADETGTGEGEQPPPGGAQS